MYRISVLGGFESAHFLENYNGKCENVHGHNYKVEIRVLSDVTDDSGLVIDFKDLRFILDSAANILDHKLINDVEYFKDKSPSSENIAKFFFDYTKKELRQKGVKVEKVRVWENERQWAEYFE